MIPQLITVRYGRRVHIPVLPVALLLSPLLVLALIGGVIACVVFRINPVAALAGVARLLWVLPGTRIDIEDGATALQLHFR